MYDVKQNKIHGWMGDEELRWLYEQAQQMRNVLEVGSWRGRSTHALLSGCKGEVYAVDHFKGSENERKSTHADALTQDIYSQFIQNVGHFPNLRVLRMDSLDAAAMLRENLGLQCFDMIFIDANHQLEPFMRDVQAWLPLCKKLFCGHDTQEAGVSEGLAKLNLNPEKSPASMWRIHL